MSSKPPFIPQEGKYACALACLRMLLAHNGIHVSEEELFKKAKLEAAKVGWINPEELAGLARLYGTDFTPRRCRSTYQL